MEHSHKLFIKRISSLAIKNGLKCKFLYDSTANGTQYFLDFYKINSRSKDYIFYINFHGIYRFYKALSLREKQLKACRSQNEMLRFVQTFIKKNYRKF